MKLAWHIWEPHGAGAVGQEFGLEVVGLGRGEHGDQIDLVGVEFE